MKYLVISLALLMDAAILYTLFGIGNVSLDWMSIGLIAVLVAGTIYHCLLASSKGADND